ncbi:DUF4405 domain-containing protein [Tangfeifania diversioriginum]|jgi:hypothetical protein|nr:DUF4405 domain-containing protein [Tangfeifania diversioriginum]
MPHQKLCLQQENNKFFIYLSMLKMKPVTRQKVNIVIDILMFVVMAALAVIGFLIRYTLISGEARWEKFGSNIEMTLFGLDRHQWGFIHLVLGVMLAVLLVLHIVFHWKQIICLFRRLTPLRPQRYALVSAITVVSLLILISPFFLKVELGESIRGQGERGGRNVSRTSGAYLPSESEDRTPLSSEVLNELPQTQAIHQNQNRRHGEARMLEIKGYHTIGTLAKNYNVSAAKLKNTLNIPSDVSSNERLGRIRRIYGFSMREVEECILALQHSTGDQTQHNNSQ